MCLRTMLAGICGYQRTRLAAYYATVQKFSLKTQLRTQRTGIRRNYANYSKQKLKLLSSSWIQRLKEENVPEAELSVKFITEHVLGKERTWVCTISSSGSLGSSWSPGDTLSGYWNFVTAGFLQ